jgi:glycosyltransferase involved in cell wall biosynthesis
MKTILLISPYWREDHRWMVSSVKLAELWQRLGYRVVVACMGSETSMEVVSPMLTIHRRRDVFLPDPLNFGIAFGFTGFLRRIVREERPDRIVFCKVLFWTSFAAIPLRLRGYSFDIVTDALVGITWKPRSFIPKIIMGIGGWTVGWLVLLSAQRIVFYHPQPQRILRILGIAKKSRVIPTGIDPKPFGHSALVTRNSITITYVGRLESVKGVDDFLAAAEPLLRDHHDVRLRVAGWFAPGNPLVERYKNSVEFTGLVNDVRPIYASTDIFVLPSYSEGLSNALMEAMASGCACIASDVGGNRYLIQNGVSGFLFPAGDREALRSFIRKLIEDPAKRKAMGEAARKRIEEHFSWDKVGEMYQDFLSNAL